MATRGKRMPPPVRKPAPSLASGATALGPVARFDEALEHHRAGRLAEAQAIYGAILAVDPNHADSLHLSGMVAYAGGRLDEAMTLIERAVALQPKADIYLGNLGNVVRAKGDLDRAAAIYQRAIAANPDNPLPYSNLGNVLMDQGRLSEAIECYERALQRRPDFYETLFNLGLALRGANRVDAAVAVLRRAVEAHPQRAEGHYTLGQTLLLQGKFAEAWPEYDWRWKLDEYAWLRNIHGEFAQPRWRGEDLAGKTLLVYAEQGMGDSLHFVRYLPQLAQRAAKVVFAVHPRLKPLLAQVPGIELTTLETVPWPAFDFHSPLLSLPQYLGTLSVADIPGQTPYLQAEPARVTRWAQWLAQKPGFKVGIAWQGNPNAKIDKGRSPPLAQFAALAAVPGVRLISLQRIDGLEQLAQLPQGMNVEQLPADVDLDGAFVDTAAIMMGLDLLVLSDSAIAHLGGALGRPVWVPLKQVPDWRFLLERPDTPWYPNMRLFRQAEDGAWSPVFAAMADELRRMMSVVAAAPPGLADSGAGLVSSPAGTGREVTPLERPADSGLGFAQPRPGTGREASPPGSSSDSGLGFVQPRPGTGREAVLRETPGAVPPAPSFGGRDFSRLAAQLDAVAALPRWRLDPAMDRAIEQQMLERLRIEGVIRPGVRVLDVDCGEGRVLDWLRAQGAQVQGLGDAATVAICRGRGFAAQIADASLVGTDLPAASFDLLWSRHSLQRSLVPYHTLSEYSRLLGSGGCLYVDLPAADTVMNHQAIGSNFSAYTQSMWQELFLRSGFTQVWGIELGMPVGAQRDVAWAFLLRRS